MNKLNMTPAQVAAIIGLLIALFIGGLVIVQSLQSASWQVTLVPYVAESADAATTVDPDVPEPEPPTSGTAVGYAGYSRTPRAQTADLSIIAHHVAVPVDWTRGEGAETTFRWPSADADWVGTTAYHWLAFPEPPGHPNTPTSYESQHGVSVEGVRYTVLISEAPLAIAAELMTVTWPEIGE